MDAKTISWVSYLTFIGWIIAFVSYNNNPVKSPLATLHLRQSFGIVIASTILFWIIGFTLGGFAGLYSLYWLLRVLLFIMWIVGFIAAVQGEAKVLPVIGASFQQWFSFIR